MGQLSGTPTCTFDERTELGRDDPATAVAALPDGGYAVLYRDPARIELRRPSTSPSDIPLDAGDVTHIGHALFHEAAGTGATCAGCHPEGGEDGHVWAFETGSRRSQTLLGGILDTAPFHWDGSVEDTTAVMDGTFVGRMGGVMPRSDEVDSFAQWMDELPALPGAVVADADAVERGRVLFESADAGCTSCHVGDQRTNNQTVSVGTEDELGTRSFQVPALYEVAYHAPYMHDGRAGTLTEVVEGHEGGAALSDVERADVVAYLRSL
jgi:mono/diheme cytochrome c family protein